MKKAFLSTLLLSLFTLNAYSKDITYITIGNKQLQNINNVNDVLKKNQYGSFTGNYFYWGTGNRNINEINKIMIGSETNITLENSVSGILNGYTAYTSGAFSSILNVGYSMYSSANFNIYPSVGLGLGRTSLDFYKKPASTDFETIINNPENGSSIVNTSFVADLGVASDYVFRFGKKESPIGIGVGLKAGYILDLYSLSFNLKDYKINNVPNINNNGFYLKAFIGYEEGIIPALISLF